MPEVNVTKEIVEIKKILAEGERKSDAKFNVSVGLFALALALTFIPPVPNFLSGILLAIGGFIALFVGLKQSKKDKGNKSAS